MADIFISYAKIDRMVALQLGSYFESEGWTVWWDNSLGAGDVYRDEIMKQLAAARAVITIWSTNSIQSDWVRAEAGRAKADGKLIPVKTADVSYTDIPLPFGEMHTENVSATDLIRSAVVAQLAKPTKPISGLWQVTQSFNNQVFSWVGICGVALTIFANTKGILNLADWAKLLVQNWRDLTKAFWDAAVGWIGIQINSEDAALLSFVAFSLMLVAGVNLASANGSKPYRYHGLRLRKGALFLLALTPTILGALLYLARWSFPLTSYKMSMETVGAFGTILPIGLLALGTILQIGLLVYVINERALLFLTAGLFLALWLCLAMSPDDVFRVPTWWLNFVLWAIFFQPFLTLVVLFTPTRPLFRRLVFIALGVLLLAALNEISKLNLHRYLEAPKAELPVAMN